jgi:hypothetical protein
MKRVLVFFTLLIVVGCSPSTLTRSKAKKLIEAQGFFQPHNVTFKPTTSEWNSLRAAGFAAPARWAADGFVFTAEGGVIPLVLTESGKKYFALNNGSLVTLTPSSPRVLEVTGITDDATGSANVKVVAYTWSYQFGDLPSPFNSMFKDYPAQSAIAALQLYDDGWRVTHL